MRSTRSSSSSSSRRSFDGGGGRSFGRRRRATAVRDMDSSKSDREFVQRVKLATRGHAAQMQSPAR